MLANTFCSYNDHLQLTVYFHHELHHTNNITCNGHDMPCQHIPLQQIVSFSLILIIEISIKMGIKHIWTHSNRLLNYDVVINR
jgi:hypothetical protein